MKVYIFHKDLHKFYDFCPAIFSSANLNISVIKTLASRYHSNYKLIKYFILIADIFYLATMTVKCRKSDFIFFREFNTISFLILAAFIFPFKKRILLNVNHNFQRCKTSRTHQQIIGFLDKIGFVFFCFEDNSSPIALNNHVITIPFPIINDDLAVTASSISREKINVGVVGAIRKEKNIPILLEALTQQCSDDYNLILGCDDNELLACYRDRGWTVYNTLDYDDYLKAMNVSDILVFNYSKDDYFYRHSGVLTDGIINKKIVIAPAYPYFSKQLKSPVTIGLTFKKLDDVRLSIDLASEMSFTNDILHEKYREYRSVKSVSNMLNNELESLL